MRIDFLRHGQPIGGDRFRGQLYDDPLTPLGWEQMRQATCDYRGWHRIITSPLLRCAEFAEELAHKHNLPLTVEPRLQELGYGDWEGLTAADILQQNPEAIKQFWQNPLLYPPPGGEHLSAFQARFLAAWNEILTAFANQHLLIITHGGVIRLAFSHILAIPLANLSRITVTYAALTGIAIDKDFDDHLFGRLIFHNASVEMA